MTADEIAEAEARGYQRAIDALRDGERLTSWLDSVGADADDAYWASGSALEIITQYLEASAQTAIRSGESTDEQ